ncbi:MAG: glycosyltransferase 87 family protein [Actinomycetota bacterium]|nr:glycosyltransferase 87 family protein [Actinomycetota bacterium]
MARAETQGGQVRAGVRSGRLAVLAGSVTALVIASLAGSSLGFLNKAACRAGAWNVGVEQYQAHCYTDIYPLYFGEGLWHGQVPYFDHQVEYPVLIGAAMQAAAWVVRPITDPTLRGREFFDVTAAGLVLCAIAGVLATAYLAGRSRRWTALLVALSPALILASFINWDLIAMALTTLAMAAWAGRRGVLAGVLFGLAIATKFYPIVLIAGLFPLCLRAGRLRAFWVTAASAAAAWLVVDVPVAVASFAGWSRFYRLNSTRGADWGSIWYFFEARRWPVLGTMGLGALNLVSLLLFVIAFALIAALILAAPRRPRVPQVFFLVLASFLLVNKVWSPQYVIWLVPLVVLARPRLWSCLAWQAAEAGYFFAIWAYLISQAEPSAPGGIGSGLYFAAVLARFGAVALLCALVVKDILRPGADVVRADGRDDPAGGVLAGAPDSVTFRRSARLPWEYPAPAQS